MKRVVANIPAGVGLDAALATLRGLGDCYPADTLSLGTDRDGGMRVVHDPDASVGAAAPATRVELGLGVDDAADLLTFAFGADDQQDALRALALALVAMLENAGAANYLTYTIDVAAIGRYAVTIQRCAGTTPAEQIADLQAQFAQPQTAMPPKDPRRPSGDNPAGWTVVEEDAALAHPTDDTIPVGVGPAVRFDPVAARAWLAELDDEDVSRAVADYNIFGEGMYDPTEHSPGDWIERLINHLAMATPAAPHVWHTASGVDVEVVETVGVEQYADGGAVLVVEVGGLRMASHWLEAKDLASVDRDDQGRLSKPQIDAAIEALTVAAETVNRMVEHHRTVRATDIPAATAPSRGLSGQLAPDDIECALHTLADLWTGYDPRDVLSERQRVVADRLVDLLAQQYRTDSTDSQQ